jgi:pimeloyl-ACP methyl ester carboxylesterase
MLQMVMIPALGCDAGLYAEVAAGVQDVVRPRTVVATQTSVAGCVAQVLAEAEERFIVLGTSFGGRVALETALAAPRRVAGLVVIGAGAGAPSDPAAARQRISRIHSGDFAGAVRDLADHVSYLPGPLGKATRQAFTAMAERQGGDLLADQTQAMASRGDSTPRLAEVAMPALMLWGRNDEFSPARDGQALAAAMAQARYVEIADCGHFPSLEAPAETIAILQHWLQDSGFTSG